MLDRIFDHPYFWRHFVSYCTGGVLITLGLCFPAALSLIPLGASLLAAAGTGIIEPPKEKAP
jgi:hypothetical protein